MGIIKNRTEHIIAIPESVRLTLKNELIPFLKIQRVEVRINIKEEIFSFFENFPRDLYLFIRLIIFKFWLLDSKIKQKYDQSISKRNRTIGIIKTNQLRKSIL